MSYVCLLIFWRRKILSQEIFPLILNNRIKKSKVVVIIYTFIISRRTTLGVLFSRNVGCNFFYNPTIQVKEHIDSGCQTNLAKRKPAERCRAKGCKQRELIPVLCASCKLIFCLRHRHENDHNCSEQSGTSATGGEAQSRTSATACEASSSAATRFPFLFPGLLGWKL